MSMTGLKFHSTYFDKIARDEILSVRLFITDKIYQAVDLKVIRCDNDGLGCEYVSTSDTFNQCIYHFLEFMNIAADLLKGGTSEEAPA